MESTPRAPPERSYPDHSIPALNPPLNRVKSQMAHLKGLDPGTPSSEVWEYRGRRPVRICSSTFVFGRRRGWQRGRLSGEAQAVEAVERLDQECCLGVVRMADW